MDKPTESNSTESPQKTGTEELSPDVPQGTDKPELNIPDYMYVDAKTVGYNDLQSQADIYNWAITGNIPLFGDTSILDIGAGRGDLLFHIQNELPGLDISYRGFEINTLLAYIGNKKIMDSDYFGGKISPIDFLTADISEEYLPKYDHVFMIGSLNLNYGWDIEKWAYLEMILKKAISLASENVTFILLHDNGGEDQYLSYPIPNMTDLILKFNYPFTIEYGVVPGMYKLTIKTKPIYITE